MEPEYFNIDVIPLSDIKIFISENNFELSNNIEDLYKDALYIINTGKYSYLPESIRDWIIAKNLRNKEYLDIPTYKSSDIILSSYDKFENLAKQLNLIEINKDQILRILTYLGKLDNDMSVFDKLPDDNIKNIMSNLDCESIMLMCKLSIRILKICNEDNTLINILKERFTSVGYDVTNFDLKQLINMCKILNRKYPTMTGNGDKLYVLNNDYIYIITFRNINNENFTTIEKTLDATNVIQIVYTDKKLLMLNNNGTLHYINLDSFERIEIVNLNNVLYILPETKLTVITADGTTFSFGLEENKVYASKKIISIKIIDESIGTCNSLRLTTDNIVYDYQKQIPNLNNIVRISSGDCHNLALRSDGKVYSWGENEYGQLGLGNEQKTKIPTQISDINNVVDILAGSGVSLFLTNNGKIYKCGREFDTIDDVPYQIEDINDAVELYQNRNYYDSQDLKLLEIDDIEQLYYVDNENFNYQFVKTSDNIYYILIGNIVNSFQLV
jgi:hypothetical protein